MPNTTILSSAVNQNFTDIATGLSNVLTRDGQAGMTAALGLISGSSSAPSLTANSDATSGLYFPATGSVALVTEALGLKLNSMTYGAISATVSAGGSGYAVGDTIYPTGGTSAVVAAFTVATLSGSAVATVTMTVPGIYTATPSNPVAQGSTSGAGTGCTLTVTYNNLSSPVYNLGITDLSNALIWPRMGASSFVSGLMAKANGLDFAAGIGATNIATVLSTSFATNLANPYNLRINATVGASALTVAIKTAANADATAASPIFIGFRDSTLANGDALTGTITGALSFTVSSTNTLGTSSSNVPFRIWVIAYYNAGTVAVGLFNSFSSKTIFPLPEYTRVTTAASTTGGNNAGTHYANVSAITNTPFRILGYLEWASGLATAGTWASAPTTIQLFGPGIKKPGDIIQQVLTSTGEVATGSTVIPEDDTIPQNSEGDQYFTQAITPTSTVNLLQIESNAFFATSSGTNKTTIMAIFQDSTASALACSASYTFASNVSSLASINYLMQSGTTSSTTFNIRAGNSSSAGTTTLNGTGGARKYGGVYSSYLSIKEIMV